MTIFVWTKALVGIHGVDVVINLVDQVHGLRERLRLLMEVVKQQDADIQ